MGKRKPKDRSDYRRKKAVKEPYKKVLIVCEGEKTESQYFREITKRYDLGTAEVIGGECGSAPSSIFEYAKKLVEKERRGDPFDCVFCVFDKDTHPTYDETLRRIENTKIFSAITSVPCFEYWVLLHYAYSTKPYTAMGKKSAGDRIITDLKKHFPDYEKARTDLFSFLFDKLGTAKKNANLSLKACKTGETDNPSTHVHELVEFLQNLKK